MTSENGKRTAAQLDRDIAASLAKRGAGTSFDDLIRDDDPGGMQLAEDFLLERGWKLRGVTGGLHARNFTIEMKPMHGSRDQWKMVQVQVFPAGKDFPGFTTAEYSVANGPVRVRRSEQLAVNVNDTARIAVLATAWAIAKAIKPLHLDASQKKVEAIVDEVIDDGLDNLNKSPEELF